jgi:hypothetical protein
MTHAIQNDLDGCKDIDVLLLKSGSPQMTPKLFSLGAILSVTDGHLFCDIGEVYRIVDHLTGDSITTIGLLAAHEPCKAALLAQHPQLAAVVTPEGSLTDWRGFLAEQVAKFGAELPVVPMAHWEKRSVADDILDVSRLNPNAGIMAIEL